MKQIQLFTLLLLFILLSSDAVSKNGVVVVMKGYVSELGTNKPVSCKLKFIDQNGKQVKTKTLMKDGSYDLVMQSGNQYSVVIPGHILPEGSSNFEIQSHSKYVEIVQDFKVTKIDTGMVLYEFNAFAPKDTALVLENLTALEDLQLLMRNNFNIYVNIEVSSSDTYFKKKKVKEYFYKGKRKRYRWKKLTPEDQIQPILTARVNAIQTYVDGMKIRMKNVTFSEDLQIIKPPKKKKKRRRSKKKKQDIKPLPIINNVKVTVTKIRKF